MGARRKRTARRHRQQIATTIASLVDTGRVLRVDGGGNPRSQLAKLVARRINHFAPRIQQPADRDATELRGHRLAVVSDIERATLVSIGSGAEGGRLLAEPQRLPASRENRS